MTARATVAAAHEEVKVLTDILAISQDFVVECLLSTKPASSTYARCILFGPHPDDAAHRVTPCSPSRIVVFPRHLLVADTGAGTASTTDLATVLALDTLMTATELERLFAHLLSVSQHALDSTREKLINVLTSKSKSPGFVNRIRVDNSGRSMSCTVNDIEVLRVCVCMCVFTVIHVVSVSPCTVVMSQTFFSDTSRPTRLTAHFTGITRLVAMLN